MISKALLFYYLNKIIDFFANTCQLNIYNKT